MLDSLLFFYSAADFILPCCY